MIIIDSCFKEKKLVGMKHLTVLLDIREVDITNCYVESYHVNECRDINLI